MWWLTKFWLALLDERGEVDNADLGPGPDDGGEPKADNGAEPGGEPKVDESAPLDTPKEPKYGEFGDSPTVDQVFEALTKHKSDFENLKGKTTATEANLNILRKTLQGYGIKTVTDDGGNLRLIVDEPAKKPERKLRFTDDHARLFDKDVLAAIRLVAQDVAEEMAENTYDGRLKTSREAVQRRQMFTKMRDQAVSLMFAYFPMLDGKWDDNDKPTNKDFNKAFHDKATQIWESKYPNDSRGELLGALEAAKELNIIPQALKQAEKTGFEKGREGKKILGPVGGGSKPGERKSGERLGKEAYLKLSPEEKVKYNKEQAGVK